jgi:exodeoxyribonuclease VII large subunit
MAAMMVVPDSGELMHSIDFMVRTMNSSVRNGVTASVNELDSRVAGMNSNVPDVSMLRVRVDELADRIQLGSKRDILQAFESLESLKNSLRFVGPRDTLERGYSIVENSKSGKVVTSTSDVSLGDEVKITVSNGAFEGEVNRVIEDLDER